MLPSSSEMKSTWPRPLERLPVKIPASGSSLHGCFFPDFFAFFSSFRNIRPPVSSTERAYSLVRIVFVRGGGVFSMTSRIPTGPAGLGGVRLCGDGLRRLRRSAPENRAFFAGAPAAGDLAFLAAVPFPRRRSGAQDRS